LGEGAGEEIEDSEEEGKVRRRDELGGLIRRGREGGRRKIREEKI
jgi:hypothetical protein